MLREISRQFNLSAEQQKELNGLTGVLVPLYN